MGISQLHYSLNNKELLNKYKIDKLNSFVSEDILDFNTNNDYNLKYIRINNTKNWDNYYNLVNRVEGERLYTNGIKQQQHQQILRELKPKRKNNLLNKSIKKSFFI